MSFLAAVRSFPEFTFGMGLPAGKVVRYSYAGGAQFVGKRAINYSSRDDHAAIHIAAIP